MNTTYGINQLLGKTIVEILPVDDDAELIFLCDDGSRFRMYHGQECCEGVFLYDTNGDLDDIIGSPITLAEESTNSDKDPDDYKYKSIRSAEDSFTWTFYRLQTAKGMVVFRWIGESNGYYSVSVDVVCIEDATE